MTLHVGRKTGYRSSGRRDKSFLEESVGDCHCSLREKSQLVERGLLKRGHIEEIESPFDFRIDLDHFGADGLAAHISQVGIHKFCLKFLAPYFHRGHLDIAVVPFSGDADGVAGLLRTLLADVVIAVAEQPQRGDVHALHRERKPAPHWC